jgi:hypothetical protein
MPMRSTLRNDPRDLAMAGRTTLRASPCKKRTAHRLDRSVDSVEAYCKGRESNPVFRHDQLLRAVDLPFELVAHAMSVATESRIRAWSNDQLVQRWREITNIDEHDRERDQNRATYIADAEDAAQADEAHAAVLLERAAIRRELARRKVDPR